MNGKPTSEQKRFHQLFTYSEGLLIRNTTTAPNAQKGDAVGSYDKDGYLQFSINKKKYKVHRVIFFMHHGYWPKLVDHGDEIKDHNEIDNLRDCDSSQNKFNTGKNVRNTSGFKNVFWNKEKTKWQVSIKAFGKLHNFGRFDDIYVANLTARRERLRLHGEFANHGINNI